jgi:hypothetical protein
MASNNSNYNKISVKTDSMVKMIEQLSKLGVFKEKRKPRAKKAVPADVRQTGDMGPGYVTTLEGEIGRGNPNLFSLRQVQPGMTLQQIADIQERNNAGVAALREEVSQQRLADIEQQQGQRFSDITRLGGIMNPILERFRGAQEPGAGQRIDPFAQQTGPILLPDIQEETFGQTINEGGPRATPAVQTELFAGGEEELGIQTGEGAPFKPIEQIRSSRASGVVKRRDAVASTFGLGLVPKINQTTPAEMRAYYMALFDAVQEEPDDTITNKAGYFKAINDYLDSVVLPE